MQVLLKVTKNIEPSKWRALGIERCVECGELEVANSHFFPEAYEKKRLVEKPICRYCLGYKG